MPTVAVDPKFKVGDRVKLSPLGRRRCVIQRGKRTTKGIVVRVERGFFPAILWDYRKTASSYHPDYIMLVEPDVATEPHPG